MQHGKALEKLGRDGMRGAVRFVGQLGSLAARGRLADAAWADPAVDLAPLGLTHESRVFVASPAGDGALNLLTRMPGSVLAACPGVDDAMLAKLKLAALRTLPSQRSFHRLFSGGGHEANFDSYMTYVARGLDAETRAYWERPSWGLGDPRIARFSARGKASRSASRQATGLDMPGLGLLGWIAGTDPSAVLGADGEVAQGESFDRHLAPVFDNMFNRVLLGVSMGLGNRRTSLGPDALRRRVRRIVDASPVRENPFAMRLFGGRFGPATTPAVPDYLMRHQFDRLRDGLERIEMCAMEPARCLEREPLRSVDAFLFQAPMDALPPGRLVGLWARIARTAAPGARILFRTTGELSPVETDLPARLRTRFTYDRAASADLLARDRSGLHGGVHLYKKTEE